MLATAASIAILGADANDGIRRIALNRREPLTIAQRIAMQRCKSICPS